MSKLIGLTGSIATGKTFVSNLIMNQFQLPVIEADKIAKGILKIDEPAYKEVVENFGKGILLPDQEINRKELREIIFHNEEKRLLLNSITHKYIQLEYNAQVDIYRQEGFELIFYDAPLLFEVKLEKEFDKIILVYIPKNLQINRLMLRDSLSYDDAVNAIGVQMNIEKKKLLADFVIDNSKTKENTLNQVQTIIETLRK